MLSWRKRRIGRTKLHVTALGLGTATLGGSRIDVSREGPKRSSRAAWDAGVRYVDTAPFYGVGAGGAPGRRRAARQAARRMGAVHQGRAAVAAEPDGGASPTGASHPLPFDVVYDYSYDGIMRSMEDSFQRLGLARIDILYVHDIGAYQHGPEAHAELMRTLRDSGYRALEELRGAGAVQAIGIGVNEREVCSRRWSSAQWDAFLLAGRYTLLEQAPLDDLIPKCLAAGTSIVVGGPLNSGILAGRDTWNYDAAPPEIVARVQAIAARLRRHSVPLPAAALQFPLAHPVVAAIIPGPRNADEFHDNLNLLHASRSRPALWSDLKQAGPAAPRRAGAGRQRSVVHRKSLEEPPQQVEELVEPVVVHPVPGAVDRDDLGVLEMARGARPPPGWRPSSPCRRPAGSGR